MKPKKVILLLLLSLLTFGTAHVLAQIPPVPNGIQFEGRLTQANGAPLPDGSYSVRFSLWSARTGGTERWNQTHTVTTENGDFSVLLYAFPTNTFNSNLYLEMKVGANAPLPRQQLLSVPYAFRADMALNVPDGSITSAKIANGTITAADFAAGTLNSLSWLLGGNNITNPVTQFFGTTSNQPLAFRTNNGERMRLLANGNLGIGTTNPARQLEVSSGQSIARFTTNANVNGSVLEFRNNTASPTFLGALNFLDASGSSLGQIGYLGEENSLIFRTNRTERVRINSAGRVGIGTANPIAELDVNGKARMTAFTLTTGAAAGRVLVSDVSGNGTWQPFTLSGTAGGDLTGTYPNPSIANNAVTTTKIADSAVTSAKIANNAITTAKIADGAVTSAKIADGTITATDIAASFLTAGGDLTGTYPNPVIADGAVTSAKILDGTITGADIADGTITAADLAPGLLTGWSLNGNTGTTPPTQFLGTTDNQPLVLKSNNQRALQIQHVQNGNFLGNNLLGGYWLNTINAGVTGATVFGGWRDNSTDYINQITDHAGTVSGGVGNRAGNNNASLTDAWFTTVGGGFQNVASSDSATVGGGATNTASGVSATIPGGVENTATGFASFAAGRRAKASHDGAFVWGDSTNADIASTGVNQFIVRAAGGVAIFTNAALTTGMNLLPGDSTWNSLSDRNAKTNFQPVDVVDVLERLAKLPITTWNYKANTDIRHIGLMAQDFHAAFGGLGMDDKHISTVDADGVALAAIQGLNRKLDAKEKRLSAVEADNTAIKRVNGQLKEKNAELEAEVLEIKARLERLEAALRNPR